MENIWVLTLLIAGHVVMAVYGCLLVRDSFKLSAAKKKPLMVVCVLVPLIGFALAITLAGKNEKHSGFGDGSAGGGGFIDSGSCSDGGGE